MEALQEENFFAAARRTLAVLGEREWAAFGPDQIGGSHLAKELQGRHGQPSLSLDFTQNSEQSNQTGDTSAAVSALINMAIGRVYGPTTEKPVFAFINRGRRAEDTPQQETDVTAALVVPESMDRTQVLAALTEELPKMQRLLQQGWTLEPIQRGGQLAMLMADPDRIYFREEGSHRFGGLVERAIPFSNEEPDCAALLDVVIRPNGRATTLDSLEDRFRGPLEQLRQRLNAGREGEIDPDEFRDRACEVVRDILGSDGCRIGVAVQATPENRRFIQQRLGVDLPAIDRSPA